MKRIAFFLPNLQGGGAERVVVNLLQAMATQDIALDLVLASAEGVYLDQVPKTVRIIDLKANRVLKALVPLASYLQQNRPNALISHLNHANVIAVLAKKLSQIQTSLILVEHNTLSSSQSKLWRGKLTPLFMKWFYPSADMIAGVSQGVSADLQQAIGLADSKITTIYNPVVNDTLLAKANQPLAHPWFQANEPPVFLGIGRLTEQKDFATLIRAFARLRQSNAARLMILGDGELRERLEALVQELGLAGEVLLPGFVENPYAYLSRATAFVLSSRWEGLPTVLIEAMACGCSVISTDCPSGPHEILEGGRYGQLVPIADVDALARAMVQVLETPQQRDLIQQRGQYFSAQRSASNYLALLNQASRV